jgi:hypothetical protein
MRPNDAAPDRIPATIRSRKYDEAPGTGGTPLLLADMAIKDIRQ